MLFQLSLNSKYFKKYKERELLDSGYFSNTESTISWLSKIVITLFFTPVVAVNSLFAKASISMVANIILAICYLCDFFYRAIFGAATLTDTILTLFIMALFIAAAIFLISGFFPVTMTVANIIFSINIIATAINSVFLIKNVIIAPLKRIADLFLGLFGYNLDSSLITCKEFTLEDDKEIISLFLVNHFLYDRNNITFDENEIAVFNKMVKQIVNYLNKYNERFLGSVVKQQEINYLEKIKVELTQNGDASNVLKFFRKKLGLKTFYKQKLETAKTKLEEAINTNDIELYNKRILKYFKNAVAARSLQDIEDSKQIYLDILANEIAKQQKDISDLEACIPKPKKPTAEVAPTQNKASKHKKTKRKAHCTKQSGSEKKYRTLVSVLYREVQNQRERIQHLEENSAAALRAPTLS